MAIWCLLLALVIVQYSVLVVRGGKCSGIKGSMYKVMKTFFCRGSANPVTIGGCTGVDIANNANLELDVDGDADAAVETRIQTGWNKLRQLVAFSTLCLQSFKAVGWATGRASGL